MWKCAVFSSYRRYLAFHNVLLLFYKSQASWKPLQVIEHTPALCGGVGWAQWVAAVGEQVLPHPQGSRWILRALERPVYHSPSSWFTGFLLCPGAVICPTKAIWILKAWPFLWPRILLPTLWKDSDFRSLCVFLLLTNVHLWPEETARLSLLFCSPMWTIFLFPSFSATRTLTWASFPPSCFFLVDRTRSTSSG